MPLATPIATRSALPTAPPIAQQQGHVAFTVVGITTTVHSLTVVSVAPSGSPNTSSPLRVIDVDSDGACAAPVGDGSRSCTVTITAPIGPVTVDIATYASGDGSGQPLATGTALATSGSGPVVQPIRVTLLAIIASIAFDRGRLSFPADGARHSATLRLVAKDAAGSFIIAPAGAAPAYSIANDSGNALSLTRAVEIQTITVGYDASRPLIDGTITATLPGGLTASSDFVSLRYQPQSIAVVIGGSPVTFTIAEAGTAGPFTVASSDTNVGTALTSGLATQSGGPVTVSVNAGNQAGTATLAMTDPGGTTATLPLASSGTGSSVGVPSGISMSHFSGGLSTTAALGHITRGPDGKIWFSEGNAIGNVTPAGTIAEITGYFIAGVAGITAGPDGNIWFAESDYDDIGFVSPVDSSVMHFPLSVGDAPTGIVTGRDGSLWVAESGSDHIGRVSSVGYRITAYPVTAGAQPAAIAAASDGNLWFTEPGLNRIGRMTTAGVLTEFAIGISAGADLADIAAGNDGNLWFTERSLGRIGRITLTGVVTEFAAGLTAASAPQGIVGGFDGNLWFTESAGNRIGRITPQGVITEFGLSGATPAWIARADDGSLWFTQTAPLALGRARI